MSDNETMKLFFVEDLREIKEETADFKLTFDNAEMGCGVLLFRFFKENELTLFGYIEDVPDTIFIPAEIEGFPVTRIDENVFDDFHVVQFFYKFQVIFWPRPSRYSVLGPGYGQDRYP